MDSKNTCIEQNGQHIECGCVNGMYSTWQCLQLFLDENQFLIFLFFLFAQFRIDSSSIESIHLGENRN